MTSRRAGELRSLPSPAVPVHSWRPCAAPGAGPAGAAGGVPPVPPRAGADPRAVQRAAWVALALTLAAVAVVTAGVASGLPLWATGAVTAVLVLAARAVPLVVHGIRLRACRRTHPRAGLPRAAPPERREQPDPAQG